MRFLVVTSVLASLILAGCDSPIVKDEYFTLDQLKETKKFVGYEVYEQSPAIEGPYRLSKEVNTSIPRQGNEPFHYQVRVDDVDYEFKIEKDAIGFGFRFLSVRNEANELGIFLLKSKNKVPDILERNKEKLERMNAGRNRKGKGNGKKGQPGDAGGAGRTGGAVTAERVLARLKEVDTDGDGKITKEDLPQRFQSSFEQFDENTDGFIDGEEAKVMAESIAETRADEDGVGGADPNAAKTKSDEKAKADESSDKAGTSTDEDGE